jgi:hypothetical protein
MYPTHRTRRLSVTLAGLAAAALALPAGQGTATAASHRPHHHAAQVTVQQTLPSLTFTDLQDLANVKRDLFQRMARQTQNGTTFADRQDLANIKRGLVRRSAERSPRR